MNSTLTLTREWDKTFPQNAAVDHCKVTFHNRFGIELAADLYKPKNAAGKRAAVAVSGPFGAAKEVYADGSADANGGLFGLGEPNTAYAQYFTGESFLNPLTDPTKTVFLANVTFSPACRNNWHIHHAKSGGGQLLLCTDGLGWYQEAGKPAQALHPGDVVTIPAGVKHWHGAQKDCWFSHIAVECPGEETSNEWCEPVTDAEYAALDASEAKI